MSEICDFYFWRLQFEVPFRHFDKMKAFRQICLQATFSWTRQDRFFCLRPCFFTPEQKYGLKWRAILHLPLPQCVKNSSMFSAFYFHSSFCYLLMAKQAVLTRNCTLFDTKFTRKALARHQSTFQTSRVAFANSTREVLKTLTSSQQNRREKRSFSTLFGVCNFWHFDSISYILYYIITLEA